MNNNSASTGLELGTVLFVVFLVLKLTHNINWSWWLVTCPLWLPIAILAVIGIGGFLLLILTTAMIALTEREN